MAAIFICLSVCCLGVCLIDLPSFSKELSPFELSTQKNMDGDGDYEWQPPSDAEMKIIQARRERSDKISKLMGDYMLKGYKMLGIVCIECSTILLQDKHGVNYCVACKELDTDTDKDDPVLSQDAARSQILEGSVAAVDDMPDVSYMSRLQPETSEPPAARQRTSHLTRTPVTSSSEVIGDSHSQPCTTNSNGNFSETVDVLSEKISWATLELKTSSSVEYCMQLCQLIKSSADALQSIKCTSSDSVL